MGWLPYQQNLKRSGLRTVVLGARSNRYHDLEPLIPAALQALEDLRPGEVHLIRRADGGWGAGPAG